MIKILSQFIVLITLSSCVVSQTKRFAQCEFRFKNIEYLNSNGVDLIGKSSLSQLGWKDGAKLTSALAKKNVPFNMQVNLDVKNNNSGTASLIRVDWLLVVQDKEIAQGTTHEKLEVTGNGGTATLPLSISIELFEALKDEGISTVASTLWAIAKDPKNPKVMKIKLRPYFNFAGKEVKYPGYINIKY